MNTHLVDFYINDGPALTDQGMFTLKELIDENNHFWEHEHSFIQWLFPLPEASRFNHSAPLLDPETIAELERSEIFKENFKDAQYRFLAFLNDSEWCTPGNHNLLRVSRVLRSMRLLGFERQAQMLCTQLTNKAREILGDKAMCLFFWEQYAYGKQ